MIVLLAIGSSFLYGVKMGHAAGWIIYWDRSYHGKVIDADTKNPIEGAVVVAIYRESCYGVIQTISGEIGVKEVLTDKEGNFRIPPFFGVGLPICWHGDTDFFVYIPGYGTFPRSSSFGPPVPISSPGHPDLEYYRDMFRAGVVIGLPPLKTKKELKENIPSLSLSSERLWKKLKNFRRLENQRREELGFKLLPSFED